MEKKTLIKIIFSTVGGLIFSLRLCRCLIPEWNLFTFGVGMAISGGAHGNFVRCAHSAAGRRL